MCVIIWNSATQPVGALGKVYLAFNPQVNPIKKKIMELRPGALTDITLNYREEILGHLSVILELLLFASERCVQVRTHL
jgi:hypothetical protein